VGAINSVGPYLFPRLISELGKTPIKLIIEEGFTETLSNKLLAGELDAIIVAKPFNKPNLITLDLFAEPLKIILPKNHKWATGKSKINPLELMNETMLLLDSGNCFREHVLQICPGCTRIKTESGSMIITTSSIETIKHMVSNGIGISIVPSCALTQSNQFVIKEFIKPTPKRDIIIAMRKSSTRIAVIHQLAEIIKTIHN
ncbi:MAG: LysR family transcriptional regulator, partial [Burkholderiales bacterium]|nr:LysR family transcriptional regulator [Burkholderiales bacterium]